MVTCIFSFSPQCFQKSSSSGWLKIGIVWERAKAHSEIMNIIYFNPLPDDKSELKELADDNIKFDENGRKLSKCRASDLRCACAIDARFQENGAQLFMVMRPSGASSLVVNKS